jgi:hypothetical protein
LAQCSAVRGSKPIAAQEGNPLAVFVTRNPLAVRKERPQGSAVNKVEEGRLKPKGQSQMIDNSATREVSAGKKSCLLFKSGGRIPSLVFTSLLQLEVERLALVLDGLRTLRRQVG